jgi:putative oxidoreductase
MASGLSAWTSLRPHLLSALRIITGLLFLQHGTTKFLGLPQSQFTGVPVTSIYGIAGLFELIGGALLVLGLFTRPVAFVLSGVMAVAYFHDHAPQNFYPILNGGELAIAFCFAFLYLSAAGGGPWSLDAIIRKKA